MLFYKEKIISNDGMFIIKCIQISAQPANSLFQCNVLFQRAGNLVKVDFVPCKNAVKHLIDKFMPGTT